MKEIDISVIIPVYNVEKYLSRCIDSVLVQKGVSYEIILVDDGSSDNSSNICDFYEKNNNIIKVIHKENEGLGCARNSGIDVAEGKYFFFLDSDDYIVEGALRALFFLAENNSADLVVFDFYMTSSWNVSIEQITKPMINQVYSKKEIMREYFYRLPATAWTKLYRRELFAKERFSAVPLHEDAYSMHLILNNVNLAVVTNQIYYIQYIRPNSLTQTAFARKNFLCLECGHRMVSFAKKEYPELEQYALNNFLGRQIYTLNHMVTSGKLYEYRNEARVLLEEIENTTHKIDKEVLVNSNIMIQAKSIIKNPYYYIFKIYSNYLIQTLIAKIKCIKSFKNI